MRKQTPLDPGRPTRETESSTTSSLKLPSRPTSRTESKQPNISRANQAVAPFIPPQRADYVIPGRFIEFGEYNDNLYGTSLESIRRILAQNKSCVVDVQPEVSAELQPGLSRRTSATSNICALMI